MHCSSCGRPIRIGTGHYNRRDATRHYCSKECFYRAYIAAGPTQPVDKFILWPLFELQQLTFEECVRFMCAYDDLGHLLVIQYPRSFPPKLLNLILNQYRVRHLEAGLVVALANILSPGRLFRLQRI